MIELKKIEVDGEVVNLSKTTSPFFSKWHVVYPIKNEDGSINWKHLITGGTWWNLIFVLLFILVFLGAAWEYNHSLKDCTKAMEKLNQYEYLDNPIALNPVTNSLRFSTNFSLEANS